MPEECREATLLDRLFLELKEHPERVREIVNGDGDSSVLGALSGATSNKALAEQAMQLPETMRALYADKGRLGTDLAAAQKKYAAAQQKVAQLEAALQEANAAQSRDVARHQYFGMLGYSNLQSVQFFTCRNAGINQEKVDPEGLESTILKMSKVRPDTVGVYAVPLDLHTAKGWYDLTSQENPPKELADPSNGYVDIVGITDGLQQNLCQFSMTQDARREIGLRHSKGRQFTFTDVAMPMDAADYFKSAPHLPIAIHVAMLRNNFAVSTPHLAVVDRVYRQGAQHHIMFISSNQPITYADEKIMIGDHTIIAGNL